MLNEKLSSGTLLKTLYTITANKKLTKDESTNRVSSTLTMSL